MPLYQNANTLKRSIPAEMRERFDRTDHLQRAQAVSDYLKSARRYFTRSEERLATQLFTQVVDERDERLSPAERERLYDLTTDQLLNLIEDFARDIEYGIVQDGWMSLFRKYLPENTPAH